MKCLGLGEHRGGCLGAGKTRTVPNAPDVVELVVTKGVLVAVQISCRISQP